MTEIGPAFAFDVAERVARDGHVPGLVVAVVDDEGIHRHAAGVSGFGRGPMTEDSVFRIASVTKLVTAACVLSLVDEGRLHLDDPVEEVVPEFAARRVLRRPNGPLDDVVDVEGPLTIHDVLNFTLGVGMDIAMFAGSAPWPVFERSEELGLATLGPPRPEVQPSADEWIARLAGLPWLDHPGRRFLYNTGAAVAGVIASRVAGGRFGDVVRERVTGPLAMSDTGFWCQTPGRLVTGYRFDGADFIETDPSDGVYAREPNFDDGGAGLVSTALDLALFARELLDPGTVLTPASLAAMTRDQLTPAQKVGGGFGDEFFQGRSWGYGTAVYDTGAFGWDGGLGTSFLVDPTSRSAVVVMTQRMFDGPQTPPWHLEIQRAAIGEVAGRPL